jgi:hypothetical protein
MCKKFGDKEVGRRGQGGSKKGDPHRSGRWRPIAPRSAVGDCWSSGGRLWPAAGGNQRSPTGCGLQPTCQIMALFFLHFLALFGNFLFKFFLKALACSKGLGFFGGGGGGGFKTPIFFFFPQKI